MRGSRYHANDEHRRYVQGLAQRGGTWKHLSTILGVGEKTLRRHYAKDYERGRVAGITTINASMWRSATRGDRPSVEAAKLLLARLGEGPATQLGVKAQREQDAENAERGTEWDGLLN